LVALEAVVHTRGGAGERLTPIEELYRLPDETPHLEHTLQPGELIVAVEVPMERHARHRRDSIEAHETSESGDERPRFSMHAFAVFAEVAVDPDLGLTRVRRIGGAFGAGRIVNPKMAHSQAIGGMVGGIGMALMEHTVNDLRNGRIVNANLVDYPVPVNADIIRLYQGLWCSMAQRPITE
jgi:CO/xanthine dehydrogenase Mo-binding subunit